MSGLYLGNLIMDDIVSEFYNNARLAYISSRLPGYKLCGLLNKNYNFNFRRNCSLDIVIEKEVQQKILSNSLFGELETIVPTPAIFPIYQYCIPHTHAELYLIGNQFQTDFLVPSMKHVQFYLMVKQHTSVAFDIDILELFAAVEGVDVIKEIEVDDFEHKLALVFE